MIRAELVASLLDAGPGAYKIKRDGIMFNCPCGCGKRGFLGFDDGEGPGPCWQWDGNRLRPTLSPSVQTAFECRWHGWLRDGRWERA